ncbi:hypothetical protein I7I51_00507 [Histoplasma capsulatum]|uniref:Uncharacterized protein n=1 Tax=Ajellomyces capsulatus TaxID=5037 RepID=A0A8A1MBY2_AJECA|nr:hypothetical protein I7I51_00507 [Histoplasma capsulatum]
MALCASHPLLSAILPGHWFWFCVLPSEASEGFKGRDSRIPNVGNIVHSLIFCLSITQTTYSRRIKKAEARSFNRFSTTRILGQPVEDLANPSLTRATMAKFPTSVMAAQHEELSRTPLTAANVWTMLKELRPMFVSAFGPPVLVTHGSIL